MEITALFPDKTHAESAARALSKKGIKKDEMSIIYIIDEQTKNDVNVSEHGDGEADGAMAGLLLGAGATTNPEIGIPAHSGPFAGLVTRMLTDGTEKTMSDFGFSEYNTHWSMDCMRRGNVYFSVPVTADNGGAVSKILRDNRAENISLHKNAFR